MSHAYLVTSDGAVRCDGIEWDLEYTIDRSIRVVDVVGSAPRLVDQWIADSGAASLDMVDATFTTWMSGSDATDFEAKLPPYANLNEFDLWLPGLPTTAPLPGFGNYDGADDAWKFRKCTMTDPVETMSRKGPRMDLIGYRFAIHFSAHGGGIHQNERGGVALPSSIPVPSFLPTKFAAHQIQDWSRSGKPLPIQTDGFGGPKYAGVQHGRRRDAAVMLDHLTAAQADEVVSWFRRLRGSPFVATGVEWFGPGQGSTDAVARSLKVNRGAGWWFDLALDLSKL